MARVNSLAAAAAAVTVVAATTATAVDSASVAATAALSAISAISVVLAVFAATASAVSVSVSVSSSVAVACCCLRIAAAAGDEVRGERDIAVPQSHRIVSSCKCSRPMLPNNFHFMATRAARAQMELAEPPEPQDFSAVVPGH